MADDDKKLNSGQKNSPQKNKSINVTKPKHTPPPMSNIDASRVSAHTMKEQQALEKLKKQIGSLDQHENRASKIKSIVAIILVIILLAIIAVFILLIFSKPEDDGVDNEAIKVSMEIENKSALSVISEEGFETLRPIFPGDVLPIRAYARNSDNYSGDIIDSEVVSSSVYVRFKIRFILNYEDRYDVIVPTLTKNWTKFDLEKELSINNGVKEDDHYYYYCGALANQQRVELFSELEFDGNKLFIEDAGKYGQIQVIVETIKADYNYLVNDIWPTAPKRWILDIVSGKYDK